MLITYILIAFNEEKIIARCIQSILNQDITVESEIIVVNDGSTDATLSIVKQLADQHTQIKCIDFQTNQGRGAARKAGVEAAHGEYIAFVDADIILPTHWLRTCLQEIKDYDAVGGIAVPDGDVTYIYNTFNLTPRIKNHTTTVSGGNGLFRSKVLKSVQYDANLKNGEDVEINERFEKNHYKLKTLQNLIVDHREHKDFIASLKWLYESGIGATHQFIRSPKVRLPDIATGISGVVLVLCVGIYVFTLSPVLLAIPVVSFYVTSLLHVYTKFSINDPAKFLLASILNTPLIAAYYCGRYAGIFKGR